MAFREFSSIFCAKSKIQRYLNYSMHPLVHIVQSIDITDLTILPFFKKIRNKLYNITYVPYTSF